MLPTEIKNLIEEAVRNEMPKHFKATRDGLQKLHYEFSARGTLKSSMYDKEYCDFRVECFKNFGNNVANVIKGIPFDPTPNCEQELIEIANSAMTHIMEQDAENIRLCISQDGHLRGGMFKHYCQQALQEVETAIKIHVHSMRRNSHQQRESGTNIVIGSNINLQSGNGNTAQNVQPPPPEKKAFYEKGTFWGTVILIILTFVLVYFEMQKHAKENHQKEPKNNSDSESAKNVQGGFPSANSSPNSAIIVGSSNTVNIDNSQHNIDNSQKNYFGETNHPVFKLYLNSPDNEFTNGAFVKLPASREIKLYVKNMSKYSVPDLTVQFIPDRLDETNLILDGWSKKGEVVSTWHFANTNMGDLEFHAPEFVFNCGLTPPSQILRLPSIFISKNFIPINAPTNTMNFYMPTLAGIFNVFATGSPLQNWSCGFYVDGQDYPPEKVLKQGYIDGN